MGKSCMDCANCMYHSEGDSFCDASNDFKFVLEDWTPTGDYYWCKGKYFEKN